MSRQGTNNNGGFRGERERCWRCGRSVTGRDLRTGVAHRTIYRRVEHLAACIGKKLRQLRNASASPAPSEETE